jgi:cation diffusion facilitator family transporter
MKYLECADCGKRAAWVTLWGNAILVVLKFSVGIFGGSHALVADAIHSSADVVIALVTIVALAISGKGPDKDHPYGHGKIEFISASLVTVALLIAVVFLFKGAIHELKYGVATKPRVVTFVAAIVSIMVNELMFRVNQCAGKTLKSPALVANAWHNRYDAYTSIVVALGIFGALLGFKSFDPIAAMFVGIIIMKISFDIFHEAYTGLMDVALSQEEKESIRTLVNQVEGINKIAFLEGRRMGQKLWIDLSVVIPSTLSVHQGYNISSKIRELILLHLENIEDIQVETITET